VDDVGLSVFIFGWYTGVAVVMDVALEGTAMGGDPLFLGFDLFEEAFVFVFFGVHVFAVFLKVPPEPCVDG
jgi:hypothetical protein